MSNPKNEYSLDRKNVKFVSMESDQHYNDNWWHNKSVEERFYAIEFLRHQYMEMNGIEPVMDKSHYEVRQ